MTCREWGSCWRVKISRLWVTRLPTRARHPERLGSPRAATPQRSGARACRVCATNMRNALVPGVEFGGTREIRRLDGRATDAAVGMGAWRLWRLGSQWSGVSRTWREEKLVIPPVKVAGSACGRGPEFVGKGDRQLCPRREAVRFKKTSGQGQSSQSPFPTNS